MRRTSRNRKIDWVAYIRFYFPKATDGDCHDILWGNTCFPFGRIAQIKRNIQQLRRATHLSKKSGLPLCEMCSNLCDAKGKFMCSRCSNGLQKTMAA